MPAPVPTVDLAGMLTRALADTRPWENITDFATHPSFCGNRLYPRQETALKLAHLDTGHMTDYDRDVIGQWSRQFADKAYTLGVQEDIWARIEANKAEGRDHFRTILAVMGRRAGKGHLGGILLAERLAHLIALDDPQAHYGILDGHDIYALVAATTAEQAQKFLFADLVSQVQACKWLNQWTVRAAEHVVTLRTPADLRREARLKLAGVPPTKPLTSVVALPVSSNSAASRGAATLAVGFDEFAFMRSTGESHMTDEAAWNAIVPSMDQFGKDALTYIPSSPWTKMGKFYQLYDEGSKLLEDIAHQQGRTATPEVKSEIEEEILTNAKEIAANPEILIIQQESWGLYEDWQRAPWVLHRPLPKPTTGEVTVVGVRERRTDQAAAVALDAAPGEDTTHITHEGRIWELSAAPAGDPTNWGADWCPARPGPTFQGPIQTRPDPDGDSQARSMHRLEQSDPQLFRVERRGQFRVVKSPYIHPDRVRAIFDPWQGQVLQQRNRGATNIEYWMHIDPAKTGADMAMCIGHTETVDGRKHLVLDQTKVWRAKDYPDQIIDYLLVVQELEDILTHFPTLTRVSMDQFNSIMPMQHLRAWLREKGRLHTQVVEETFTAKLNERMWAVTKTAINEGLVHAPEDSYAFDGGGCLLREELLVLEEDAKGHVIKPDTGPISHDDMVDCLGVLALRLLGDSVEELTTGLNNASFGLPGSTGGWQPKPASAQLVGDDPLAQLRALASGGGRGGGFTRGGTRRW